MEFPTKNNYIYENLKDEIVEGKRRPGERIAIPEVAKRYNVSGMPVREALNRLHQDGLIEIVPHVGARVMNFDMDKFKEIMMIRIALEALAAKMSTPYINDETKVKLEELHQEMIRCAESGQYSKYSKLNKEFHQIIYSAGPYPLLSEMIGSLWTKSEFSRNIFGRFPERVKVSIEQHKRLLEAIKNGDADKAHEVVCEQNDSAYEMILAVSKEIEQSK
ncbi:MAG TPA: GntR family transcriptional regulator [Selenomonadales bacterium]|nr:GntR family transcriptional regulator [Selenomonadales bacterium]